MFIISFVSSRVKQVAARYSGSNLFNDPGEPLSINIHSITHCLHGHYQKFWYQGQNFSVDSLASAFSQKYWPRPRGFGLGVKRSASASFSINGYY